MSELQHAFWDEACAQALSDASLLSAMARFEGALALASAHSGVVPDAAARTIAEVAEGARFDAAALAPAARRASTLAIPFVKQLTEKVAVVSPEAARYVHFGATSQDVIDTGVALCLIPAAGRVLSLSKRLGDAAAVLSQRHARTPMAARTLLQPAVPVPFGWKAAVWLSMLARSHVRFRTAAHEACVLQFGGAGGTLSVYAEKGDAIAEALVAEHERGLGQWQSQWFTLRDLLCSAGSGLAAMAEVLEDLGIDEQAMLANLDRSRGMVYSENVSLPCRARSASRQRMRSPRNFAGSRRARDGT